MKHTVAIILILGTILGVFTGCTGTSQETTAPEEAKHPLDGKKVIIIGNSHTYVGKTVIDVSKVIRDQKSRENNRGLFYQLCKENGAEVAVTNWCFSGHGLRHLFGSPCSISYCKNERHEDYLVDRYFDYVVVTPGVGTEAEAKVAEDLAYVTKLFRDANPDVKFVLLGNASVYGNNKTDTPYPGITGYYKTLEEQGWLIADWGGIVNDIIKGKCTVPGSTLSYNKNSFIIKDGYHPNMLSGYITTMMLYCTLTGEKAVDQPRNIFTDNKLWNTILMDSVKSQYEAGAMDTIAHTVLTTETELMGIQQIIDRYLAEKPYRQNAVG